MSRAMLAAALALPLFACFPVATPAPAPAPTYPTAGPAGAGAGASPQVRAACEQPLAQASAQCDQPLEPTLSREEVQDRVSTYRAGADAYRQSCPADLVAPLDACVQRLAAVAPTWDPDADARRAAARPRADRLRDQAELRDLQRELIRAQDDEAIDCGYDDEALCRAARHDREAAAEDLERYLVGAGLDRRDLRALGLWPAAK